METQQFKIKHLTYIASILLASYFVYSLLHSESQLASTITLSNGETITVLESVTLASRAWLAESRIVTKRKISFSYRDKIFNWTTKDSFAYPPIAIDVINDNPTLVFPVYGYPLCKKYNFPVEGIIALAKRDGNWQKIPTHELPENIQANYPTDRKPMSVATLAQRFINDKDSCLRIKKSDDDVTQAVLSRSSQAEFEAANVQAELISYSDQLRTVPRKSLEIERGHWTGSGYLLPNCAEVIDDIRQLEQWTGDSHQYRSNLLGYEVVLQTGARDKKNILIGGSHGPLQMVACDRNYIYAVRREDTSTLIIDKFDHNGEKQRTYRISLPKAANFKYGKNWSALWSVTSENNTDLSITIVDYYDYPDSGTITQTAIYKAILPI